MGSDRETLLSRRWLLSRGLAASAAASLGVVRVAAAGGLRVGEPAPRATLVDLDGKSWVTSDLQGKVVILTFWATWCGPCREELPLLSAYSAAHESEGLIVLGFCLDERDSLAEVRKVAGSLHFPVGLLANSQAAGYGRPWRIPVNFTIARDGRLVDDGWKDRQPTWTEERLSRIVTPLLA